MGVEATTDEDKAEGDRAELRVRLTKELQARSQDHERYAAEAEERISALADRVEELELELATERSHTAGRIAELEAEIARAHETLKPRSARRVAEVRTELAAVQAACAELEQRIEAQEELARKMKESWQSDWTMAQRRIGELEAALDESRQGWDDDRRRADESIERATAIEQDFDVVKAERDAVEVQRAAVGRECDAARTLAATLRTELEQTRADDLARIDALGRGVEAERAGRAAAESSRRELEQRLAARDEAERGWRASREAERQVAQAHRQELSRVERRLTQVSSGLATSMRRLQAPAPAQAPDAEATPE